MSGIVDLGHDIEVIDHLADADLELVQRRLMEQEGQSAAGYAQHQDEPRRGQPDQPADQRMAAMGQAIEDTLNEAKGRHQSAVSPLFTSGGEGDRA